MPESLPLFPFQHAGVEFLAARKRAMLLDQQGLGKTVQAIRAADMIDARSVAVVCPSVARGVWRNAFCDWSQRRHNVTITSYDFWSRGGRLSPITPDAYDLLILDEVHYLKSYGSKRTEAMYGKYCHMDELALARQAGRIWCLSGTPTPNGAHEMYPHLRALAPELILNAQGRPMSPFEFTDRYCRWTTDARGNVKVVGLRPEHLAQLKTILQTIGLRRTKKQVLPDLPPLRIEVVPLTSDKASVVATHAPDLATALDALENDDAVDPIPMSTARRCTGEAKVDACFEWIRNKLDDGCEKIVVFAHHTSVLTRLKKAFDDARIKSVVVSGSTPAVDRTANALRFQTLPECRVFLGQIVAAGTAVTLTAASDVAFVEASWVPAENAQAAERCHRIGTRNAVTASFLTLEGSIDEAIQRVLARKMKSLIQLWSEA